jgi:uncharacterized protein YbjT (DUF2867 family)
MMRVVVTGGTGFTGERVVQALAKLGIATTVAARQTSDVSGVQRYGASVATADLGDRYALSAAFDGHHSLLHVASMGFGQIPDVIEAAKTAGIRRAVFVSTTAVLTSLPVRSKPIRAAAETCVRESGLDWTIIRPTMIYGSSRDRNMCRLLRHLRRWRIAPIPGQGSALQQPVHVDDVADAIVQAALRDTTVGREYVASGARPLTLRELIATAAEAVGTRPVFLPLPSRLSASALRAMERIGVRLPIRAEQLDRLNEDKAFCHLATTADLDFRPRDFAAGIRAEAEELGLGADR